MKKKLFVTAIILAVLSFFLVSFSYANTNMDNAVNNIRNFVGGTENAIEDAGQDVSNGIKNGMNTVGNDAKNVTNGVGNAMNNNGTNNNKMRTTTMNGNNGYTAARTSTDTGATGLFGNITNNVWTWAILAVVGIVIVALVMYYAKQNNITTYNPDDNEEE